MVSSRDWKKITKWEGGKGKELQQGQVPQN